MDTKRLCWIGMIVGSGVGGYLPALWGGDLISGTGLLCALFGGLVGIWLGYRIGQR